MPHREQDTDALLARAQAGEAAAVTELLSRYRRTLKKMVRSHMDSRLAARVDPSDVVQDTLLLAAEGLQEYAKQRPMPLYAWLRRLAWQRLIDLHRRHLKAGRRSVAREEPLHRLNDASVHHLARRLATAGDGPHSAAALAEQRKRIRHALDQLEESQRELLLLHYVEDLSLADAAEVLQISAEAARMRHFRALKRLRELLGDPGE